MLATNANLAAAKQQLEDYSRTLEVNVQQRTVFISRYLVKENS
ncbi:hypothetical protein MC7420_7065 [Coleofasciculus chthonoplastes PCC 7420]|uniref:Uncharacterized protein n=1 Tax=Coleofasciculus chthonoplastes PCC 7420 TaxID=118168 RepID=B4VH36_9CYAN|nr:hypothetical protein [Coleofasciculus chthonoplastes]EDX78412.1 hypothetical protein MC7420_7065 [Coleofasciculus chthonoplastes PCC 7420]